MVEKLKQYFRYQSYEFLKTNLEYLEVLYKEESDRVQVLVLNAFTSGLERTKEQYHHILQQIQESFFKKGYTKVEILSLICTKNIDRTRDFCENDGIVHWIVDMNENRLVVYENQPSSFYSVRDQLESILIGKLHVIDTSREERKRNPVRQSETVKGKFKTKSYKSQWLDWKWHKPVWTILIVIINIVIFIITATQGQLEDTGYLLDCGGTSYDAIVNGHEYYRLLSAMFLHADFEHILNNMFILILMGERLEMLLNGKKFLIIYFVSGIVGNIGSVLYYHSIGEIAVGVGASGAIFGVIGGIIYLAIKQRGRGLDITPARLVLFLVLVFYSGSTTSNVDNTAHIVGLITGILVTGIIESISNRKRNNQRTSGRTW